MTNNQRVNRFLADGEQRDRTANFENYQEQISKKINDKYAKTLKQSGFFKRICIRYKIRAEIREELAKRFSKESLYLYNQK